MQARRWLSMIVVVAALGLVGFGGKSKPAIKMLTSVQIEYVDEPMGAMQLPADTVRVPDSQLIVAGDHYSAGSVLARCWWAVFWVRSSTRRGAMWRASAC